MRDYNLEPFKIFHNTNTFKIFHNTNVVLGWKERLSVLWNGKVRTESIIEVNNEVNILKSTCYTVTTDIIDFKSKYKSQGLEHKG